MVSLLQKVKGLVSSLQKVKTFLFYSINLTDCFFTTESEEIGFFTAEVKMFLFCSANLIDCFFAVESEEIVSLLQKVKRLFLYCRK